VRLDTTRRERERGARKTTHLDLVDVDLAVLLLELLVGRLHGVDGRHRVAQVLGCEGGLLHVERLLLQLADLSLVQLLLLEDAQRALLHGALRAGGRAGGGWERVSPGKEAVPTRERARGRAREGRTLPGPSRILRIWSRYFVSSASSLRTLTSIESMRRSVEAMASVRDGFGLADDEPKRRFMAVCGLRWCGG